MYETSLSTTVSNSYTSWYGDYSDFVKTGSPWFTRGRLLW